MKKRMRRMKRFAAVCMALIMCTGCSFLGDEEYEEYDYTDSETFEPTVTPTPVPTATISPTSTPVPTQVPLKDLVFVRPSFANVVSGVYSYADERGNFKAADKKLTVTLPVDDSAGFSWKCLRDDEEGPFTPSEGTVEKVPFAYSSGKFGGRQTPKSEIEAAEKKMAEEKKAAQATPTAAPTAAPEDEEEVVEYEYIYVYPEDDYYEEPVVVPDDPSAPAEPTPEPNPAEDPNAAPEAADNPEGTGEGSAENEGAVAPVNTSLKKKGAGTASVPPAVSGCGGIKYMSAEQSTPKPESGGQAEKQATPSPQDMTYVYAPHRTRFTFTPDEPGTDIFYLECSKKNDSSTRLDNGFILFVHADENLDVKFDLVWYSFAQAVAAPDFMPESQACVTIDKMRDQEAEAAKNFDSCVRDSRQIGAVANMDEDAHWEVYVASPSVAEITGSGGAAYHEDFTDYSWDVFTVSAVGPGRTTAYFRRVTSDDSAVPRMQVADIQVSEDLTMEIHVRRLDMDVDFD